MHLHEGGNTKQIANTSIPHSKVQSPPNKNGWFCVRAELEPSCIFGSNKNPFDQANNGVLETLFQMQVPNAFLPLLSFKNAGIAVATYETCLRPGAGVWQQNLPAKTMTWQSPENVLISRSRTELCGKRDGTELSGNPLFSMTAFKISPAASERTMV